MSLPSEMQPVSAMDYLVEDWLDYYSLVFQSIDGPRDKCPDTFADLTPVEAQCYALMTFDCVVRELGYSYYFRHFEAQVPTLVSALQELESTHHLRWLQAARRRYRRNRSANTDACEDACDLDYRSLPDLLDDIANLAWVGGLIAERNPVVTSPTADSVALPAS